MRIVCAYESCGPSYVRLGIGRVCMAAGHEFMFWMPKKKPAFDMFSELQPDLLIGTTFDLDRALYKCISRNPKTRVILYASDWGPLIDTIDINKYPIVVTNTEEKKLLEKLKRETGQPEFIFKHYTDNWLDATLSGWKTIGLEPISLLNAADTFTYFPGQIDEEFLADISFIGGYWKYKAINLDKYLLPFCFDDKIKIKIYGNQPWPAHQYLGFIQDDTVRNIFASSKICPNVSEPHSTDFGFDIVERPFKVLSSGGFCISDYVEAMKEVFHDSIPCGKTPAEFQELIRHYLHTPQEISQLITTGQRLVLKNHTYFERCITIFNKLKMFEEVKKIQQIKPKFVGIY